MEDLMARTIVDAADARHEATLNDRDLFSYPFLYITGKYEFAPFTGDEIDILLESQAGDLIAVEVKDSASIRERDWRVMGKLRDARTDRFKVGVVLYSGRQTIPLGDRIWAVPISGLWA